VLFFFFLASCSFIPAFSHLYLGFDLIFFCQRYFLSCIRIRATPTTRSSAKKPKKKRAKNGRVERRQSTLRVKLEVEKEKEEEKWETRRAKWMWRHSPQRCKAF
jgi:hypothetical protein